MRQQYSKVPRMYIYIYADATLMKASTAYLLGLKKKKRELIMQTGNANYNFHPQVNEFGLKT